MKPARSIVLLITSIGCGPTAPERACGSVPPEACALARDPIAPYDPLPYVDPFIGTGTLLAEIASVSPGASAPFGMTLVGPDTTRSTGFLPFHHWAGYHYDDDRVLGFSLTHAHGMGVGDYGGVRFMARAAWVPGYAEEEGRSGVLDHSEESASPGRYTAVMVDDGTSVDLVATTRGVSAELRFPQGAAPVVTFDLGGTLPDVRSDDGSLAWSGEALSVYQLLAGSYSGRFGGVRHHAHVTFDPAPEGLYAVDEFGELVAVDALQGADALGVLRFPEGTAQVTMKAALSTTGPDGAEANHGAELAGRSHEELLAAVQDAWRDKLSVVRVRGTSEAHLRTFTTALYHTMLMPSRHDDADGTYRGLDQALHEADFAYYSDLSLWDTFRTTHPLFIWLYPEQQADMVRSLVRMADDGGSLPRWPLAHGYTSGMVGTPAVQVMAESALKGLPFDDEARAFEVALAQVRGPMPHAGRAGWQQAEALGWIPREAVGGAVSRQLENAWSDHALALWAERLQRGEAGLLWEMSGRWRHVWNEQAGFFSGRSEDGTFEDGIDPDVWSDDYIEGNAWHYRWYVPYDVMGMVEHQYNGDIKRFEEAYRHYWQDLVMPEEDDLLPDQYYWHGNEPVLHMPFLGALAGLPDLSNEAVAYVRRTRYHDGVDGLDGNEDGGTLSAWLVWAAMGLYPVAGTTDYAMVVPMFDRIEVDRPGGTTLVISAPGVGDSLQGMAAIEVDGQGLAQATLDHALLQQAGEIRFELSEGWQAWQGPADP